MNITIIGTGFVGVVSGAVYASFGNQVIGLDIDEKKVESLRNSKVPFYEPDLEKMMTEQQQAGTLTFTTDYAAAIKDAEVIMIAVGTPSAADGQADLKFVYAVADSLAPHIKENAIVVIKSTVPPGTLPKVADRMRALSSTPFYMASLPEFLREGSAVQDTLHPDRIIIGATDQFVFETLEKLHQPFKAPIFKVSPESAQVAKYAANTYLALRITFANQLADLCEKNGADIEEVLPAMGQDKRIGTHYWYPGFGYGGSCFPKDVKEIAAYSRSIGEENNLFNKMNELNELRIPRLMAKYAEKIGGWADKQVALLGLSFKPNTDDMREAPSLKVIPYLLEAGAHVKGYDPKAELKLWAPQLIEHPSVMQVESIDQAVSGADVIMVLIEWPEILKYDFSHVHQGDRTQWFIDARNQFDPKDIAAHNLNYLGIGR
jgi:UDPglucose 6-dehydrogenase